MYCHDYKEGKGLCTLHANHGGTRHIDTVHNTSWPMTRLEQDVARAAESRRLAEEHGGNVLWWVSATERERQAAGITAPIFTPIQPESSTYESRRDALELAAHGLQGGSSGDILIAAHKFEAFLLDAEGERGRDL
jgi:hypothetical protein